MKRKKVLLLGSYGQTNLGDDLLMWNYLKLLEERGFSEIYVNANTRKFIPEAVKNAFPNLRVVLTYKTSPLRFAQLIQKVDCIVYGGGTLYKELYASTGRSPYSVITRLMGFNIVARLLGKRIYHLNIGIGSLRTPRGKRITKLALQAASKTIFRDERSFMFARDRLRIPEKKMAHSVDGLFLSRVWEKPWHIAKLKIDRKKYRRVIGVNVLSDIPDWVDRKKYVITMQQFVATLLERGDFVVLIPFQTAFNPRNDLTFMKDIFAGVFEKYDNYALLESVPIDRVHSYLTQLDLFVGMRFHGLLLSTVCKVPFVALSYDTKCWRFVEETGYPFALKIEDLTGSGLITLCDRAMQHSDATKKKLREISKNMYDEAEDSLRTLAL